MTINRKPPVTNTATLGPIEKTVIAMGGEASLISAERRGRDELVRSSQLPRDGMKSDRDRAMWEAMGIKIHGPTPGDDLFNDVELPAGWRKVATDHHMHSHLVDDKGRPRAAIAYKAAFYDRYASIYPKRRFTYDRDYDSADYRTHIRYVVKDAGKIVFTSKTILAAEAVGDEEPALALECEKWLADNGRENYKDVLAYWDEP